MTHHDALWAAIMHLARAQNITCSKMARMCHLDATAFNPSKRYSRHGQPRWISTETLYKILTHTNTTPLQFAEILQLYLNT